MTTTARKYKGKTTEWQYFYYVCKNTNCPNDNKYHRVADLEDKAIEVVQDIYGDGSRITEMVLKHFDYEARKLMNPHQNIEDLTSHISKLKVKKERLLGLYLDLEGNFTKDELDGQAQTLNNQIAEAERQLEKFHNNHRALQEIRELSREIREALLNSKYQYDLGLEEYDHDGSPIDWKKEGAPTRNRIYKDLGLKVQVSREESWVEIGGSTLCLHGNYSSRTPTQESSKPAS